MKELNALEDEHLNQAFIAFVLAISTNCQRTAYSSARVIFFKDQSTSSRLLTDQFYRHVHLSRVIHTYKFKNHIHCMLIIRFLFIYSFIYSSIYFLFLHTIPVFMSWVVRLKF